MAYSDERLGKLIKCNGLHCGKEVFLELLKTEELDGGFTTYNRFEELPEGWNWFSDTRYLCPECSAKYKKFINELVLNAPGHLII